MTDVMQHCKQARCMTYTENRQRWMQQYLLLDVFIVDDEICINYLCTQGEGMRVVRGFAVHS